MTKITVKAPAKLNLTFDILGQRSDGYHEVSTLLQSIDLEDELHFEFMEAPQDSIKLLATPICPNSFPLDESNLIIKAAKLFLALSFNRSLINLTITIDKRIPISAGLAGGSTNAAATLQALNAYFKYPLNQLQLLSLGAQLGADVPFCLTGGTFVGLGRGDELTTLACSSPLSFLVVKPTDLSLSTAWVYKAYDNFNQQSLVAHNLKSASDALVAGDAKKATRFFGNALEPVVFHHYPELAALKNLILSCDTWGCHLSGSGPSLYVVLPDLQTAQRLKQQLQAVTLPMKVDLFMATSISYGARVVEPIIL